jgi:hypothetical protein
MRHPEIELGRVDRGHDYSRHTQKLTATTQGFKVSSSNLIKQSHIIYEAIEGVGTTYTSE